MRINAVTLGGFKGLPTASTSLLVLTAGCSCLYDEKNEGALYFLLLLLSLFSLFEKTKQNNARLLKSLTIQKAVGDGVLLAYAAL